MSDSESEDFLGLTEPDFRPKHSLNGEEDSDSSDDQPLSRGLSVARNSCASTLNNHTSDPVSSDSEDNSKDEDPCDRHIDSSDDENDSDCDYMDEHFRHSFGSSDSYSSDDMSDYDMHLPTRNYFYIRHIDFADTVDSAEERNRFLQKFESLYGSTHPVFFRGTYNQALDEAKRDLKFLLVYLHSEQHEDTEQFCRSVITSQQFVDFLTDNNLLFWSASVTSSEGYRVSQHLRENSYPYLALIVVKQNRMVVVRKFEGLTPVETLLTELRLSIEDNESGLTAARLERREREMNSMLRKEQDEAFAQSLKADQEKERKKKEEQHKKDAEEKAKMEQEMEESRRKDRLLKLRDVLVSEIPTEPEPNDPNSVKLVIKLPNGKRLERRFLRSQTIRYLYYFVFCNKEAPLNFQIRTNFPPRDLPARPPQLEQFSFRDDNTVERIVTEEAPTFEECDLGLGAMLFVHDLEA